jgi:hypothetical protein
MVSACRFEDAVSMIELIVVVAAFTAIVATIVLGIRNRHPGAIVTSLLSPVAFVALVWLGPWYQCIQSGLSCPTTRAVVQGFIGATLLGVGAPAVAAVPKPNPATRSRRTTPPH